MTSTNTIKEKALVYATSGDRLLVFSQPEHPGIGYQVPGGTVEAGEDVYAAALREFWEETGIEHSGPATLLGQYDHDMRPFRNETQRRTVYHFQLPENLPETWDHAELHPHADRADPIQFRFEWLPLSPGIQHSLAVGQGKLLTTLLSTSEVAQFQAPRAEYLALRPGIESYRTKWAASTIEALGHLFPDTSRVLQTKSVNPVTRSVLAHVLERSIQAAQTANKVALAEGDDLLQWVTDQSAPYVVISHADCALPCDARFESKPFTVLEEPLNAVARQSSPADVAEGIELVEACAMAHTLDGTLGIYITLENKSLLEASTSYTLSAYPATIYADRVNSLVRMGETLLHECSHNWLNDAFAAYSVSFPEDISFWSPWRKVERPAAGLIQGMFIFSLLVQFFERALSLSYGSEAERKYLMLKIEVEQKVLTDNIQVFRDALALIEHEGLRDLCGEELNRAINVKMR